MGAQKFSIIERRAFWEAHGKRCAYCAEPLWYRDLFLDHIVPQSITGALERRGIMESCGLDGGFDLNSRLNIVPSCHRCNTTKGASLFEPPRLMLILEIARSKAPKVEALEKQYQQEQKSENIRLTLSLALARGDITPDQLSALLGETDGELKPVALTSGLRLADGSVLATISRDDVERLMDTPIEVNGGRNDALELFDVNDALVQVRTCREYQQTLKDGCEPTCNFMSKVASDFKIALAVLTAIKHSAVPERSYVRDPNLGVIDLHVMPASVLGMETRLDTMEGRKLPRTAKDLVGEDRATIRNVASGYIAVEDEGSGCLLVELMRGDITGDGTEDILVYRYDYATQGTYGSGSVLVLSKTHRDALFTWSDSQQILKY